MEGRNIKSVIRDLEALSFMKYDMTHNGKWACTTEMLAHQKSIIHEAVEYMTAMKKKLDAQRIDIESLMEQIEDLQTQLEEKEQKKSALGEEAQDTQEENGQL